MYLKNSFILIFFIILSCQPVEILKPVEIDISNLDIITINSNPFSFIDKKIDGIYCLSVNDEHVMKSWLLSYTNGEIINGIADGNAEITKYFDLLSDKTKNYMGFRCRRFAMIIENNMIINKFIENDGEYRVSSAEYILEQIQ